MHHGDTKNTEDSRRLWEQRERQKAAQTTRPLFTAESRENSVESDQSPMYGEAVPYSVSRTNVSDLPGTG